MVVCVFFTLTPVRRVRRGRGDIDRVDEVNRRTQPIRTESLHRQFDGTFARSLRNEGDRVERGRKQRAVERRGDREDRDVTTHLQAACRELGQDDDVHVVRPVQQQRSRARIDRRGESGTNRDRIHLRLAAHRERVRQAARPRVRLV